MNTNKSGRKWARAWLITAMILSVGGNIAHASLADSGIHVALRIWPAALLPVFTFMGIEVLIRIAWERKFSWQSARVLSLLPAIPAAIASYEHLGSLLVMMGERTFTAWTIPGAIDGAMIASTVVLIVTRSRALPSPPSLEVPAREMADGELERIVEKWTQTPAPISLIAPSLSDREMAEIVETWHDVLFPEKAGSAESESAEIPLRRVDTIIPESPAPSRTSTDALAQGMAAVEYLLAGRKPAEVAVATGAGQSTVYRWAKVLRTLSDDATAVVNGVNADLVEYMRERVR